MKNLTILRKFSLLAVLFTLALVFQLGTTFYAGWKIAKEGQYLANHDIIVLNKAHQLRLAVVQVQQWLTDISATRGLDGLNDGFDEAKNNADLFFRLIKELKEIDPLNSEKYNQIQVKFVPYYETGRKMAKAYVEQGPAGGNKLMSSFDATAEALSNDVLPFLDSAIATANEQLMAQQAHIGDGKVMLTISASLLVVVIVIIAIILLNILKALPLIGAEVARIANGTISAEDLVVNRTDEIGMLTLGVNHMKGSLKELLGEVAHTSTQLYHSVESLTSISRQTDGHMQQQQSEIDMVATAMNQMSATAQEVALRASSTAEAAETANVESQEGKQVVARTISLIDKLAADVERAAEVIHKLEDHSENIGSILDVIRGIAEQTNLLALNAAIEAARAGEQGRGFAVVADEVRTLASRTQQSTQEIDEMIVKLQQAAKDAVKVMETGRTCAGETVEQVSEAGNKLNSITDSISAISDLSGQIASAATEQSAVAEDINVNISTISEVAVETAQDTSRISSSSDDLNTLAGKLQEVVTKFKF